MKYFTIILILILNFSLQAQVRRKQNSKNIQPKADVARKTETGGFQLKPFNIEANQLPPYFLGHNANIIINKFIPLALEILKGCDKFETTIKCQERLDMIYDRTIWTGLNMRNLLAFSIPIDCDYNADAAEVFCKGFGKEILWASRLVESSNYIGQNAFGVKKVIDYRKFEYIKIEVDKYNAGFDIINLPPDQAKKIVPNLRVLIVGEPLQPFVKSDSHTDKPTIDDPRQTDRRYLSLVIEQKELWLYDFETGKVLRKDKFNPLPKASAAKKEEPLPENSETVPPRTKVEEKPPDNPARTVSVGVINGKAIKLSTPAYPPAARAVRASGAVNVEVTVDTEGNVVTANAVSGHPLLRQSAEQAARSSKFPPTILNGEAMRVKGILVFTFFQ